MRWACFLVWVNSITWSVKVLINRAARERRVSGWLPPARPPSSPAKQLLCLVRGWQVRPLPCGAPTPGQRERGRVPILKGGKCRERMKRRCGSFRAGLSGEVTLG